MIAWMVVALALTVVVVLCVTTLPRNWTRRAHSAGDGGGMPWIDGSGGGGDCVGGSDGGCGDGGGD